MKQLSCGIRLMRWSNSDGTSQIFAKASSIRGNAVLLLRGYKRHETLFGYVMRKPLRREGLTNAN